MHRRAATGISGLLIWLISMPPAFAGERHLLVGTWSVDVPKLTQPDPPQSVTIVLAELEGDAFRMTVDIVSHDGMKSHAESTFKPDGTPTRAQGSLDVDTVSISMPSRRILVMGAAMSGHPGNTRVFSLSDDGTHMIETIISHGPDGTPHTRVNTWNRL